MECKIKTFDRQFRAAGLRTFQGIDVASVFREVSVEMIAYKQGDSQPCRLMANFVTRQLDTQKGQHATLPARPSKKSHQFRLTRKNVLLMFNQPTAPTARRLDN